MALLFDYVRAAGASVFGIIGVLSTVIWAFEVTFDKRMPRLPRSWLLAFAVVCFSIAQFNVYRDGNRSFKQQLLALEARNGDLMARITPSYFLYDRDPESWPGHKYGEGPLQLDESTRLEVITDVFRRFNPQIAVPDALRNVDLFVTFPPQVEVKPTSMWRKTAVTDTGVTFWARVGDVAQGTISGIDEAFEFRVKTSGRINIEYQITGSTERAGGFMPITRNLRIVAKQRGR